MVGDVVVEEGGKKAGGHEEAASGRRRQWPMTLPSYSSLVSLSRGRGVSVRKPSQAGVLWRTGSLRLPAFCPLVASVSTAENICGACSGSLSVAE